MAFATGHGSTIAFGTSGFTAAYRQIGGHTETREPLDTSHLGTTDYEESIPSDLADPGSVDLEWLYETTDGMPSITAPPETVIRTIPNSGGGSDVTFVGNAYWTSLTSPTSLTSEIMMGSGTLQCSGGWTETVEA